MIQSHRLPRRRALLFGLTVGGATALAACGSPAPPAPAGQAPAATAPGPRPTAGAVATPKASDPPRRLATSLRIATPSLAETIDPAGSLGQNGYQAVRPVYDALVTFDEKGERIVPQLAAAWERIDPATMEFKLRDDVKFSNGEDFTAEAVRFTVDRLMSSNDPVFANTKSQMGTLATARSARSWSSLPRHTSCGSREGSRG